jgi:hypothetical protein
VSSSEVEISRVCGHVFFCPCNCSWGDAFLTLLLLLLPRPFDFASS